ncbi:MAG: hypothetical protein QNL61_06585 [Crocinitomicaceae bacterium]
MINRVILALIFIVSLGWIGFVGLDILSNKNDFSATAFFGEKDSELLIINRPSEIAINQFEGFNLNPFAPLTAQLTDKDVSAVYISKNNPHALIVRENKWTKSTIKSLLNSFDGTLNITSSDFTKGNVKGKYSKNNLYITQSDFYTSNSIHKFKYDKKASASIIQFKADSQIESVTDIYFNAGEKTNFITHNESVEQGNQIKDEVIFGRIISDKIDDYHFIERDYSATIDPIIKDGAISKWMLNGFVTLTYNGKKALISDYILGQDPILILNDINQTLDQISFSNPLTSDFPSKGKKYHAKYLDDLVVFSEDETTCDRLIADFKLGSTIALNPNVQQSIYGNLPKSVSERSISDKMRFTKAIYRGKILQTLDGKREKTLVSKLSQPLSVNCGFDIKDFVLLDDGHRIISLGKKGEIACFNDGKLEWKKQLSSTVKSDLSLIDLHENGESYILLNTNSHIHLWDKLGKEISGFPIELENDATNDVHFYRWRGKSYFLIGTDNNRVMHFDAKGRELNSIKVEIPMTRKIDVWASIKTLYAGFSDGNSFYMYDVDHNKHYRNFSTTGKSVAVKIPNELIQFSIENNSLMKYDQKGTANKLGSYPNGKLLENEGLSKNPYLLIQSNNEIHFINIQGVSFGVIRLSFNEIEDAFIESLNSGNNIVAIIDGIENNVYLYRMTGEKINNTTFEGQTKVTISSKNDVKIITTIVDQFIVQYFIN